jgi:hypothetical protein
MKGPRCSRKRGPQGGTCHCGGVGIGQPELWSISDNPAHACAILRNIPFPCEIFLQWYLGRPGNSWRAAPVLILRESKVRSAPSI